MCFANPLVREASIKHLKGGDSSQGVAFLPLSVLEVVDLRRNTVEQNTRSHELVTVVPGQAGPGCFTVVSYSLMRFVLHCAFELLQGKTRKELPHHHPHPPFPLPGTVACIDSTLGPSALVNSQSRLELSLKKTKQNTLTCSVLSAPSTNRKHSTLRLSVPVHII